MIFPNFNPFALGPIGPFKLGSLSLGPFGVRWYALSYIIGIVLGWLYARRMIARPGLWGERGAPIDKLQLDDLILWVTLGVIAGGRLGYFLFYNLPGVILGHEVDANNMLTHPWQILMVWQGGMSFHGGALGVIVAVFYFARHNKIDPLRLGDTVVPAVPIGLFFGRIANFINGELWGRVTNVPWGMVFCNDTITAANGGACPAGLSPRHPSQLYEAGLEGLALFGVLWWLTHRTPSLQRPGLVTGVFLAGYALARLSLEQVREPDMFMPGALRGLLTMGMLLSTPMLLVGGWLIWRATQDLLPPRLRASTGA